MYIVPTRFGQRINMFEQECSRLLKQYAWEFSLLICTLDLLYSLSRFVSVRRGSYGQQVLLAVEKILVSYAFCIVRYELKGRSFF